MARYKVALIGLGRIASTIDDEVQGNPGVMLPYAPLSGVASAGSCRRPSR